MALSFVGSASNSAINGNDVTVTLPSMQEDDVVYVIGGSGNFGGGSVGISTTGYTTLDSATAGNCTAILGRKIQGATPDSSVVISGTGSSINGAAGAAHVWRGADTTTPEDATTIEVLGQGAVDSGSITTVTDGAEVLSLFADEDFDTTITAPSGYGNQDDAAANDSRTVTVGVASKNVASAGAEDPGTWSASFGFADDWAAYTVAIRPAAGGGGDNVNLGLPSETDSALAMTATGGAVSVDVGLATETDSAFGITPVGGAVSVDIGLPSETDTALSITPSITTSVPIGLATEADTALGMTPTPGVVSAEIGLAAEADTALPVTVDATVSVSIGIVSETDSVFPITPAGGAASLEIGIAAETDTALSIAASGGEAAALIAPPHRGFLLNIGRIM